MVFLGLPGAKSCSQSKSGWDGDTARGSIIHLYHSP